MARHFRWGLFLILVSVGASGFGGGRGEARDAEESAHSEKDSGVTEVEHKERPIADRQLAITDNDREGATLLLRLGRAEALFGP